VSIVGSAVSVSSLVCVLWFELQVMTIPSKFHSWLCCQCVLRCLCSLIYRKCTKCFCDHIADSFDLIKSLWVLCDHFVWRDFDWNFVYFLLKVILLCEIYHYYSTKLPTSWRDGVLRSHWRQHTPVLGNMLVETHAVHKWAWTEVVETTHSVQYVVQFPTVETPSNAKQKKLPCVTLWE